MRGTVFTTTFTPQGPKYSTVVIKTQDGTCIARDQATGKTASAATAYGAVDKLRLILNGDAS